MAFFGTCSTRFERGLTTPATKICTPRTKTRSWGSRPVAGCPGCHPSDEDLSPGAPGGWNQATEKWSARCATHYPTTMIGCCRPGTRERSRGSPRRYPGAAGAGWQSRSPLMPFEHHGCTSPNAAVPSRTAGPGGP